MRSLLKHLIVGLALLAPSISYADDLPDLLNTTSNAPESSAATNDPETSSTPDGSGPVTTGKAVLSEDEAQRKTVELPSDVNQTALAISEGISFEGDSAPAGKRPVEAQFSDPSLAGAEIREKIRLKGLLEYETGVDGNVKGSMSWYGVRNAENNEEREITGVLESRFTTSDPTVASGQTLSAQGDVPAALAAARSLLENGGDVPEEKAEEGRAGGGSGGTGAAQFSAAGGEPSNDMLEGFELPDVKEKTEEAKVDEMTLSEAGCPLKVSADGSVVQVQSQTIKNGQPQGDCSPNGTNLTVQKSYATCEDDKDLDAHTAFAQFRRFYVDQSGTTQYLDDECVIDNDLKFVMYQDSSVCSFDLELAGSSPTAFNRGKWYYQNRNNNRVEVSGCERIEDETAPILTTTEGCTPRHEFQFGTGGQSLEMVKQYFVWDDIPRVVSDCSDSGKTFAHIHKTNVCSDLTPTQADLANFTEGEAALIAVPQERIAIDLNGTETYISECKPIENVTAELFKETAGCETTFFHYLSAGESYGSTKWKYQIDGKPEITLTSCIQDNAVTYDHQTRINGYEHHDSLLYSEPKTEIYLQADGQEVMVSEAQVRSGAPQLDYVFQQSVLVATGELFYETDSSCEKLMRRNDIDRYLKGDLVSVYDDIKGEGEALSQGDGCNTVVVWGNESHRRWNAPQNYTGSVCGKTTYTVWHAAQGSDGDSWTDHPSYGNHCNYTASTATQKIVRDDGIQIGGSVNKSCETVSGYPSYSQSGHAGTYQWSITYRSNSGGFPAHSNTVKSNCLGAWGWW